MLKSIKYTSAAFCLSVYLAFTLQSCQNQIQRIDEEIIVEIQPFKSFSKELCDTVAAAFEELYGVQSTVAAEIKLPPKAFINIKSPRYRADTLISFLRDLEGIEDVDYIIGLLNEDISTTKYSDFKSKTIKEPKYKYQDWGIFGLGFRPGKSCIVSVFRLRKNVPKSVFIARLKKISCHELGHNFGLPHCPSKDCIMQDAAETIATIDGVQLHLCEDCQKKIGI